MGERTLHLSAILLQLPLFALAYVVLRILYNIFLHPLKAYPGPFLARATVLTYQREIIKGKSHLWLQKLHEKYGPVVRCSPNELSVIDAQIWKDAYGFKSSFSKDVELFYGPDVHGNPPGILRADDVAHARQRKLVSHAFSDKALKEQEQLLKSHVRLLINRLSEISDKKQNTDMVKWYNFTTFDIMADLTFGETLAQLSSASYSPWVQSIFSSVKMIAISRICREWPGLTGFLNLLVPAHLKEKRRTHIEFSTQQVDKRMARKTDRPDIWGFVTKYADDPTKSLAPTELHSNGALFMLAGTETTATELSGLTYLLLKNPEKLARLTHEVREAFTSFEDMHIDKLTQLPYLQACLEEGLRLYPPVPIGPVRVASKSGATVCGQFVPAETRVQCPIYTAARAPNHFNDAESFVPERFMPEGQEKYAVDRKDALNPFSFGPRNCLGKNLAYHEMRLILASVLLNFDLALCEESENWTDQKNFILWEKHPLMLKLKLVR